MGETSLQAGHIVRWSRVMYWLIIRVVLMVAETAGFASQTYTVSRVVELEAGRRGSGRSPLAGQVRGR